MRRILLLLSVAGTFASTVVNAASCDGFTDVDDGNATYCSAVTYVKSKGITLGCGSGTTYCPNDYVTRLQMALFLARFGSGDSSNSLGDYTNSIGGGTVNATSSTYGTIGGGNGNIAGIDPTDLFATVGGGGGNLATELATVSGGYHNKASGTGSSIVGGESNMASGALSTVLGGIFNTAPGDYSIAAGYYAHATTTGCMIFADASTSNGVSCGSPNEFIVRGLGGIYFFTGGHADTGTGQYTGTFLPPGSGSWTSYSDRDGKDTVTPVDPEEILLRVAAMPMASWHYKAQGEGIRHMGPMAQDFYAAFGLGETDKGISTVDGQGVALAAIQGLNAKLEARNAELEARLARVEALLAH